MRRIFYFIFTIISFCAHSQEVVNDNVIELDSTRLIDKSGIMVLNDTIPPVLNDSLTAIVNDSTSSIQKIDSIRTIERSSIETTINYNAKDSMYFDLVNKKLFMYGETHIDYGDISLDADLTNVDWEKSTIESDYTTDSTGKKIGKPVFKDGSDEYVTNEITYNFNTKRALIKGVITEQDGAFMHGDNVKKNEDNELFIRGARYTTCNLEHPHFFIESKKLKVIPKNKIVSGPFNVKFRDLPTPLFFPFGMFPQPKKKASGIIMPTYGEEQRRGFFLRGGGYYLGISDYVDLTVTGDIYSKGGNGLNVNTNYIKRYSHRGTFNFSYTKSVSDEIENPLETNDYWVRWSHSPQSKGNSSFSASVSAGSTSYNDNNNLVTQDFSRSINAQFTSNVSYSKRFQGTPFNISSNLRHNQNIESGLVTLTLPDFTLNTSRQYPFKKLIKSSKSPIAKLNFSHSFVAKNELSNGPVSSGFSFDIANEDPLADSIINFNANNLSRIQDRGKFGGRHSVPISTSLSILKFFTLNPSFNYQELWYTRELDYEYLPGVNAVRVDTLEKFSRAGSWSTGVSLNTRVYGTKFFKKGKIQAIRHVMVPSVSFSYSPDFSDPKYGVYREIQIDSLENTQTVSKYQGFAYGSPPGGESKTIGFSLTNNIEMKVASKKDTISGSKKIKLFDNIGLSSGYNLAADSFNLSNISLSARTSLLNNLVSVNFSGTIDPYIRNPETNDRINRFAWNNGQGIGQLTNMTTSLSMSLSPSTFNGKSDKEGEPGGPGGPDDRLGGLPGDIDSDNLSLEDQAELDHIQNNPDLYVDFNVPWSLRMNYSINRTRRGIDDPNIVQSMSFSGQLGLTSNTQISFNSGYDFEQKQFTTTSMNLSRDLHCWTMTLSWVPFGRYQSYFVSIRVKSSLLQDLKLEKRRNFFDFFN